jgi:hypothetical protein
VTSAGLDERLPPVAEADPAWLTDAATFRREIAERCRPVILRGAFRDWPVVRAAADSPAALRTYLARLAGQRPAQAFVAEADIAGRYFYADGGKGFNFQRVDLDLLTAVDRILESAAAPGSPSIYVGSLPTDVYLPGFVAENQTPLVPAGVEPRIWIGTGSNVSCHYDTFENIACVVAGQRRFTLYPPDAIGDLYVGPIDNTLAGAPVSMADGAPAGDPRYPRFAAARAKGLVAELQPGDALYLPKLWWHQVEATAPVNVLVNYWWDAFQAGPDAPFLSMLLSMITIAERPAAEREAWRAFFDHYVFRPDGHPLAHVPEEQHGTLGPLAQGNYGRIRARVMQALRNV